MKILTSIILSLSLLTNNILPKVISVNNATGNSNFNNLVRYINYEYLYVDGPSIGFEISAPQLLGITYEQQMSYCIEFNIQLSEYVESANITIYMTTPDSSSLYVGYIGENCRATLINNGQFVISIFHSINCKFKLYYSYQMLIEMYSYPTFNSAYGNTNVWLNDGYNYVKPTNIVLSSAILETETDYTQYIDGVEGSLTNIKTYLSTISTNIASIKTSIEDMLSTVNAIEDNQELANNVNKLMYAVNDSYNYKVSIPWNDISVKQWVSAGDYSARQWVKINDFSGTENIVIRLNDTMGMGDIYYFPVPSNPLADNGRWHDLYIYDYDSNIVKNIRCRVKQITEEGVKNTYFSFDMYEINLTDLSVRHVTESLQQHMYNCKLTEDSLTVNQQLLTVNEKLSNIITLLNGYEVGNVIDDNKEQSINTYFNELISGNNLPEYSAPKENFFVLFREFYEPLVNTVNAPVMQNTKFIITFMLAVGLLGVILK